MRKKRNHTDKKWDKIENGVDDLRNTWNDEIKGLRNEIKECSKDIRNEIKGVKTQVKTESKKLDKLQSTVSDIETLLN